MEVNNRRDRSCNWFNNLSVKVCSTNASDDLWLGREEKLFLLMNSMASDEKLRAKKTAKQNVSLGCDLFCHRSVVMSQPKWLHSWIGRKNTTSESVDTKIPLRKILSRSADIIGEANWIQWTVNTLSVSFRWRKTKISRTCRCVARDLIEQYLNNELLEGHASIRVTMNSHFFYYIFPSTHDATSKLWTQKTEPYENCSEHQTIENSLSEWVIVKLQRHWRESHFWDNRSRSIDRNISVTHIVRPHKSISRHFSIPLLSIENLRVRISIKWNFEH